MNGGKLALIGAIILLVLAAGSYRAYEYVKYMPPEWLVSLITKTPPPPPLPPGDNAPLVVPTGFSAIIFSRDTPGARVMIKDPKGTLLVSETTGGNVVALPDTNGDGKADETKVVLSGLKQPHGMAIVCPSTGNASADQDACVLYVAETGELKSYAYDADTFTATYQKTLAPFPVGDGHFTRTLQIAPDGKHLLISIGSSCNACNESSPLRASVQSLDLQTGDMVPFATGLRNSTFMAIDPVQGKVWATENGRDILGDDIPPDEINILEQGKNYGWPICYGQNIHDTDFDRNASEGNPCADKVPAWIDLQAHSAALGLAFVPEENWPADMRNDLLIAFHGSWNRSSPTGYKVVHIDLDPNTRRPIGAPKDFVTGFLPAGSKSTKDAIGRPVGLLAESGGTLYVSDDRAGAIYKIVRTQN